jgi:Zn-dependent protease/CBS domain-containing protein
MLGALAQAMRSWSIPVGHILGAEVRVHWTFLALLLFIWLSDYASGQATSPDRALALGAIIFGCVALHEAGHALVAAHAGLATRSLMLMPIGGISMREEERPQVSPAVASLPGRGEDDPAATAAAGLQAQRSRRQLYIALAGPVVNLLAAFVVGAIVMSVAPEARLFNAPPVHSSSLLKSLFWVNIFLAGLNALPAYPLDGGRVLRAFLSRSADQVVATRRAVAIGQSIALLFIFLGMVSNAWITLAGVFLFLAAQMEERSAVFQSVLDNVRTEEVMLTDFAILSPADTLEDALAKAVHSLQDDFPVVRGNDMVGVISRSGIVQALRARGNAYVQSAMTKFFEVARRQDSLASVFRRIAPQDLTLLPVVEDQRLIGIITLQTLMHNMAILAEARKLRERGSG